jgi:uncharacterized protein
MVSPNTLAFLKNTPNTINNSDYSQLMANIAHFEIPADNVNRAKRFYQLVLGWKIEPTKTSMDPALAASMQYHDIITGDAKEGTLSMGGMYKRQMPETPIINYIMVENLDKVLINVEKSGGKIIMPVKEITSVGFTSIIQDTEGNAIGLLKPTML